MIALSIHLPDNLAREIKEAAFQLGLSHTEFICQAIRHEMKKVNALMKPEAMAKSFTVMKEHKDYLQESEKIEEFPGTNLLDEEGSC